MLLRHLAQVVAVAEAGSFAKAARQLGMSQPALSRSIAALEADVGVTLFDRGERATTPTPIGLVLVERARRLLADSDRLDREMMLLASGEAGAVRIGFGQVMRHTLMPRVVEAIAARFPALRLTAESAERRELFEALQSGALDMLVLVDASDVTDGSLVRVPLFAEAMVAVVAPDHPLAGQVITSEELTTHPVIVAAVSETGEDRGETTPSGLPLQNPQYRTNDIGTALALARRGATAFVTNAHVVAPDLQSGALVRVHGLRDVRASVVAVLTPASHHSAVLRQVIEIAQRCGQALAAEAEGA